jgi:hypothetical protein
MTITIRITVEDVASKLEDYDVINVYRAATLGGTYTIQDTIALVADTYHYSWEDPTGTLNLWYKYSFYNTSTTDESVLSDPFRVEGTTRLRIRQGGLSKYGAGIVLINTGTDADKITTEDYRFASSLFPANRGKGQWLLPTTGDNAGIPRIISESSPTDGTMTVLPAWDHVMADGDEVEWHTLADPTVWNDAINRGMPRYYYVDIVPLVIGADGEYPLDSLPWLVDIGQIHDVRWYPDSSGVDHSFAGGGRWWRPRKDRDTITLAMSSAPEGTVVYLETTRPMSPLYADTAALPNVANEALAVALAYDEVLAYLSSPGVGTTGDRASWLQARLLHAETLHRLLVENRPKPRHGPAQLPWPPVVPDNYSAR